MNILKPSLLLYYLSKLRPLLTKTICPKLVLKSFSYGPKLHNYEGTKDACCMQLKNIICMLHATKEHKMHVVQLFHAGPD